MCLHIIIVKRLAEVSTDGPANALDLAGLSDL